jgi:hypothetical protein
VRACEQCPAQPAQQARTVFVVMFSIKVPDLRMKELNKCDAEHLLQRAMCSIERYCPLVVRYIRASGHLERDLDLNCRLAETLRQAEATLASVACVELQSLSVGMHATPLLMLSSI